MITYLQYNHTIVKRYSYYGVEYSCGMQSHFRKFGKQMSESENHCVTMRVYLRNAFSKPYTSRIDLLCSVSMRMIFIRYLSWAIQRSMIASAKGDPYKIRFLFFKLIFDFSIKHIRILQYLIIHQHLLFINAVNPVQLSILVIVTQNINSIILTITFC